MDLSKYWVLDGGLATEIESRGHQIKGDPLWSARLLSTHPEVISQVHRSYLQHGADVIITASYQASVEGFQKHLGLDRDKALDLIGRSVTIATEARRDFQSPDREVLVAGSVGPYGACQHDGSEYHGNYVDHMSREQLKAWHRPRMERLLAEGVDLLAIETIPAKAEADAVLELLQEFPAAKAWLSFSCKDGLHTCHGELFSEAVSSVNYQQQQQQLVAVGVNCSDPGYLESLLGSVGGGGLPFVVYPNSGEAWDSEGGWSGGGSGGLASLVPRWMALGARIIGGCCRVGPAQVSEIRSTVRAAAAAAAAAVDD